MVPYKGSVEALITQRTGGVRGGVGRAGFRTVEDRRTRSTWRGITTEGLK